MPDPAPTTRSDQRRFQFGLGTLLGGITAWCFLLAVFAQRLGPRILPLMAGAGMCLFVTILLHLAATGNEAVPRRRALWAAMLSAVGIYYVPWGIWYLVDGTGFRSLEMLYVPLAAPSLAARYFADISWFDVPFATREGAVALWAISCATSWMRTRYGWTGFAMALVGVTGASLMLLFLSSLFFAAVASC
jgi:hypothetical protein